MHTCGANPIYLASIAIGSFLIGGAVGLWLGKDEEDIFDENCIKPEDLGHIYTANEMKEIYDRYFGGELDPEKKESYSRMVKELYPDDYIDNPNLDYSSISEDDEEEEEIYTEDLEVVIDKDPKIVISEETGEEVEVVEDDDGSLKEVNPPYIISLEEYQMDNGYIPETVVYYAKDDILADERDEVIYDIDNTIGPDALNSFGVDSGDEDFVFVRNDQKGIDYEVIRENISYTETVLGITMDDDEALEKAKSFFNKRKAEEEMER